MEGAASVISKLATRLPSMVSESFSRCWRSPSSLWMTMVNGCSGPTARVGAVARRGTLLRPALFGAVGAGAVPERDSAAGRPIVNGEFIARNAGVGSDFLTLNLRVSRVVHVGGRVQAEALGEVFNLTNHENVLTRNGNFGAGAYPTNPSPAFGQVTAVGETRSFQIGARLRF